MNIWRYIPWMLLIATPAHAGDDDLEEAVGLEAAASVNEISMPEKPKIDDHSSDLRVRGYGLIDWRLRKSEVDRGPQKIGPNGEVSAAIDYQPREFVTMFVAGRFGYEDEFKRSAGLLEQVGSRVRPIDSVVMTVGKERNRRSPGLIISPSDFIHTQQSAPGLREERSGVWLARASWQSEDQSIDAMVLPYRRELDNGMPEVESGYSGTVLRYFRRLPFGIDLGADLGRFDQSNKFGLFVQSIVANTHKVYAEIGRTDFNERAPTKFRDASHYLTGWSYEGSSDYTLKFEWYSHDEAWLSSSPMFVDRSYLISSIGAIEIMNRFNVTDSLIRSLNTQTYANVLRSEWLASDRQVLGVTVIHLKPATAFEWQITADWKLSI